MFYICSTTPMLSIVNIVTEYIVDANFIFHLHVGALEHEKESIEL